MRKVALVALFAASAFAGELAVKEVVLYKNGVGYFRRGGELKPGESARLDFKAAEMNDVLKSLTILEEGGGKITGLRYDSSEPIERKLSEFPFHLGDAQALSGLLDQLKGARVELALGAEKVSGTILSARQVAGGEKQPALERVTLVLDSGDIRTYDLGAVTGLRFSDAGLQLQLKDYLGSLVVGRSKEKRSVYIDSTDSKARRVTATYVVPTPVWKSSYRLIFGESGEPMLEGWAIVDNTSGEDWTKVRLALVSGRPVSFVSKLYEPKYVERQVAELPEDQAAAPEVYKGAMEGHGVGEGASGEKDALQSVESRPMAKRGVSVDLVRNKQFEPPAEVTSSIAAAAEGRELGELFEYGFSSPVTVRKDESAMLPFLQQKIGARKLLIYSGGGSEFPRNAAELTNSTGKTLDGGPITVYDGNAYAGEALVETVKNGDKRLISYAVDLGTRITTKLDSSEQVVREVHVHRGMLTTSSAVQETTTYTVKNVDQKPKTLMIEHPVRWGYKLIEAKPSETTSTAYRFELKLGAGASQKFPVAEEHLYDHTIALSSYTPDNLVAFVRNKSLSDAARQQLQRIAGQKRAIAEADANIGHTTGQLNDAVQDEARVRQNMESLNRVSGQQELVQKYARQIATQETQIAEFRDRLGELRKNKATLESELNAMIEKMEF